MKKGDTVELLERIWRLALWRRQSRVHWNALELGRSDIDATTFFILHDAEIDCINGAALMRNHGRFHMADKGPLGRTEEWMSLDIGRSSAGA